MDFWEGEPCACAAEGREGDDDVIDAGEGGDGGYATCLSGAGMVEVFWGDDEGFFAEEGFGACLGFGISGLRFGFSVMGFGEEGGFGCWE